MKMISWSCSAAGWKTSALRSQTGNGQSPEIERYEDEEDSFPSFWRHWRLKGGRRWAKDLKNDDSEVGQLAAGRRAPLGTGGWKKSAEVRVGFSFGQPYSPTSWHMDEFESESEFASEDSIKALLHGGLRQTPQNVHESEAGEFCVATRNILFATYRICNCTPLFAIATKESCSDPKRRNQETQQELRLLDRSSQRRQCDSSLSAARLLIRHIWPVASSLPQGELCRLGPEQAALRSCLCTAQSGRSS